jgi:signal transduction histidine kinase
MKFFFKTLLILAIPVVSFSQTHTADSLRRNLKTAKTDSARFVALKGLADHYTYNNVDTALLYLNEAIAVAKKNNQWLDVALEYDWQGNQLLNVRKLPEAFRILQAGITLADDPANEKKTWIKNKNRNYTQYKLYVLANLYEDLGHLAGDEGDSKAQLQGYRKAKSLAEQSGDKTVQAWLNENLAHFYINENLPDSAMIYTNAADSLFGRFVGRKYRGHIAFYKGKIYLLRGDTTRALQNYHLAIQLSLNYESQTVSNCYRELANYFLSAKQADSGLFYSKKLLNLSYSEGPGSFTRSAYQLLYRSYILKNKRDSAFKYLQLSYDALDAYAKSSIKSLADVQKLSFQEQVRLGNLEKEREQAQTHIRIYVLSAAIGVFMLLAVIFYRNNRQKQKANNLLKEQKEEIEAQRDNLGKALEELKTTQSQLIQSEKMASLGELTAGIAHEIQNPLNFVNNFSEVNKEMLEELKAESIKPKSERDEQLESELINDLIENEKKINHHGRRADGIVKGMLEHSRVGTGEKQTTDLNALTDEFLKLSYYGLRAKDKSFNSELVTHFDADLPKVTVIQQDIGRVLLNLFNNALYAVNQKSKTANEEYKPVVEVTTLSKNGQIEIKVKDNGNGIPDAIKDKIMQPFFTTKPTGEGTGLGLSLSYDIVVKGHGGNIAVLSKENEGSEFIITLPI